MNFKRVAVLKGGPSAEREVSLRSGAAIAGGLRTAGYDVVEIDVTAHDLDLPGGIDAVFIALHGEFGEDGQVQQLLEERGVPYTGSGVEASRTSFDKVLTKECLLKNDIPTAPFEVLRRGMPRTLDLPVVVKPPCQGSSIGVNKVFEESEWEKAVEDAFSYGDEVLVEGYVRGRELTVGVVCGDVLPVVEIEAPDSWYGYEAKYTAGACNYIVPAPLSDSVRDRCQAYALQTFDALGCRGYGRVDFLVDVNGGLYVLEMNNIPGFTETSLMPKAAEAAGIGFADLCSKILEEAACDSAL